MKPLASAADVTSAVNQVRAVLPAMAEGRLPENIMHFARILRAAGMVIGTDRTLRAIEAVRTVGLEHRSDVHAALSAVMLDRHEHQGLFDEAFHVFWRDPKLLERMMFMMLPKVTGRGRKEDARNPQRLVDGFAPPKPPGESPPPVQEQEEIQLDATLTFSEKERLSSMDFESMSTAEYARARQMAQKMPLFVLEIRTRRYRPSHDGAVDLSRALRNLARDPYGLHMPRRNITSRTPPLVVLVDISGSMHRYSRIFLHYLHALTQSQQRVHTLTFGTRLTNITRYLRQKDADVAMDRAAGSVPDWSGGTRIASCLAEFNLKWSRRLLSGNAGVLLLTDGLDRDDTGTLQAQMERLYRSSHFLIWLNPLLRYKGFEARPAGIRAMLPYVDRFVPAHNLDSLAQLGQILASASRKRTNIHQEEMFHGHAGHSAHPGTR